MSFPRSPSGLAGEGKLSRLALVVSVLVLLTAGCGGKRVIARRPTTPGTRPSSGPAAPSPSKPLPPGVYQEGLASWYGIPYHGRRAANGEIYDMHKMTAAHRTLPFDTIVRVTNLKNKRTTEVRINDRGPFVEGRVIDLSLAAAQSLDMVAAGVVPVRLELLSGEHALSGKFTVQVGSFRDRDNAARYARALEQRYRPVYLHPLDSPQGRFYRVRVGRVTSENEARQLAAELKKQEKVAPIIVRLDE